MTATERIRELLDERGITSDKRIEYSQPSLGEEVTAWDIDEKELPYSVEASYLAFDDGVTITRIWNLTPEQAIEATLGRGECEADETETWDCVCDSIGRYGKRMTIHVMECSACGHTYEHVNGDYEYCPHCGAKVVVL